MLKLTEREFNALKEQWKAHRRIASDRVTIVESDLICRCCKIERFINPNHPEIACWRCKDHAKACRIRREPLAVVTRDG